jgi:hypothetical protein
MTTVRRLAAAVGVVLGIALLVMGAKSQPGKVQGGANRFVDSGPGIEAHNSPAVARNPSRPDVLAVADRVTSPEFSCSVSLSGDGGGTWRRVAFDLPTEAPNCFWPDVGFDERGSLLVLYTSTGGRFNLPVSVWLQRFEGEAPAGPAVRVTGPLGFHSSLGVDGQRVAVAWLQAGPSTVDKPVGFAPPHALMVARSEDGGRRFSPPATVGEADRLVALPSVVMGPGRQLVVGALDLGDDLLDYESRHDSQGGPPDDGRWRVAAWTSEDDGASFGPTSIVADDLVIPQRIIVNLGPRPGFGRDPRSGRLYATWDAGQGDDRDVYLAWSDDAGRTWTPARPVVRRPGTQTLPAVSVSPDGRVDVVFYDRGREPEDVLAEVVLASSWDGGTSFVTSTVSDRSFDARIGFGSAQNIPTIASQMAAVSEQGRALVLWTDTRKGTIDSGRQDIAVAAVRARPPRGRRVALLALGSLLVVGGAVVELGRRRRRENP